MTTTTITQQGLPYTKKFNKHVLQQWRILGIFRKNHDDKYELRINKFLNRILRKDWYAVDYGAYQGYHTTTMAKRSEHVFAFEKNIENFTALQKNVKRLNNISLLPLVMSEDNDFIFNDLKGCPIDKHVSTLLKTDFKLDDQIAKCNFIKISQQIPIFNIIKGADRLITKFHPILFIEEKPTDLWEVLCILEYEGYQFFTLRSNGRLRRLRGKPNSYVVAIHKEN